MVSELNGLKVREVLTLEKIPDSVEIRSQDLLITLPLSYWTQVAAECRKMVFPRISFKSQLHFSPLKVVGLNCACCKTARCTTIPEALLAVLISQGLTAGLGQAIGNISPVCWSVRLKLCEYWYMYIIVNWVRA